MLKIGLFSKLSRVSIRMLRYYDEIGLLQARPYIDRGLRLPLLPRGPAADRRLDHSPAGYGLLARRCAPGCLAARPATAEAARALSSPPGRRELQAETAKTAQQADCFWTQPKNGWERKILCSTISTIKTIPGALCRQCPYRRSRAIRTEGHGLAARCCAETDHYAPGPGGDPCLLRGHLPRRGIQGDRRGARRRGRPSRARIPTRRT